MLIQPMQKAARLINDVKAIKKYETLPFFICKKCVRRLKE
jgi:hypothetical protein